MRATYALNIILSNNDLDAQEQMGVIYGDLCESASDVMATFGESQTVYGVVPPGVDYLYSYARPIDTTNLSGSDREPGTWDVELRDAEGYLIYLYALE